MTSFLFVSLVMMHDWLAMTDRLTDKNYYVILLTNINIKGSSVPSSNIYQVEAIHDLLPSEAIEDLKVLRNIFIRMSTFLHNIRCWNYFYYFLKKSNKYITWKKFLFLYYVSQYIK